MSLFDNGDSILLLKKLLQPNEDSSSDSEDENQPKSKGLGPSSFGPRPQQSNVTTKKLNNLREPEPQPKPKKDITIDEWLDKQEKEDNDILETRKRPEYTISYKQSIGTEDVYLQMGNKTSASSSCEDMIIEIKLPEETVGVHQMDISVTATEIDLATPIYRLKLPLTQPINPDRSTAKYFTERKTLCLTCRMNREYDFVNF